jgi:phosphatidylglycerophosphate synthase
MARKYSLGSEFGDIFDHTSDIFKMIFLVVVLLQSAIKYRTKILFVCIFLFFMMLSNAYLGCVELHTNSDCILSPLKMLCPNKESIDYLRYTGTGTFFLIITCFIYNMETIDSLNL